MIYELIIEIWCDIRVLESALRVLKLSACQPVGFQLDAETLFS